MKIIKTLVLAVEYELLDKRGKAVPAECLARLVQHAAGEGLLTDDSGRLEVSRWEHRVLDGEAVVIPAGCLADLRKLLDYSQEAEEKHYEECKLDEGPNSPACRNHIWRSVKRLAKAIGHKF